MPCCISFWQEVGVAPAVRRPSPKRCNPGSSVAHPRFEGTRLRWWEKKIENQVRKNCEQWLCWSSYPDKQSLFYPIPSLSEPKVWTNSKSRPPSVSIFFRPNLSAPLFTEIRNNRAPSKPWCLPDLSAPSAQEQSNWRHPNSAPFARSSLLSPKQLLVHLQASTHCPRQLHLASYRTSIPKVHNNRPPTDDPLANHILVVASLVA